MTNELIDFLNARLEDEVANEAPRYHHESCNSFVDHLDCSCDGPTRTADTARAIQAALAQVARYVDDQLLPIVEALALPYRDHPDYPLKENS